MKKFFIILPILALAVFPYIATAHGMMGFETSSTTPYGMMNRMMGVSGNWGMMPWGDLGGLNYSWGVLAWATSIVWLIVGILLIIWLIKKIQGK